MEDAITIKTILYIGGALIYWWIRSTDYTWENTEPAEEDDPSYAPPESLPRREPLRPMPLSKTQRQVSDVRLTAPLTTKEAPTTASPSLPQSSPRRVLHKYKDWQRGIVMSEILKPVTH